MIKDFTKLWTDLGVNIEHHNELSSNTSEIHEYGFSGSALCEFR